MGKHNYLYTASPKGPFFHLPSYPPPPNPATLLQPSFLQPPPPPLPAAKLPLSSPSSLPLFYPPPPTPPVRTPTKKGTQTAVREPLD